MLTLKQHFEKLILAQKAEAEALAAYKKAGEEALAAHCAILKADFECGDYYSRVWVDGIFKHYSCAIGDNFVRIQELEDL